MPLLTVSGPREGTGAAANAGRADGAGTAARGGGRGECTGATALSLQQCSRMMRRLRKFSSCLALRHASWRAISQWRPGHDRDGNDRDNAYSSFQLAPLFRVFPVLNKRSPGHLGRGQSALLFRPCCLGDKRPWSQTRSAGFQNASDATPPDAQSVTESRKSCEVPSCPSFPQDAFVVGVASSKTNRPRVARLNLC
jgi:hypothetical protein